MAVQNKVIVEAMFSEADNCLRAIVWLQEFSPQGVAFSYEGNYRLKFMASRVVAELFDRDMAHVASCVVIR